MILGVVGHRGKWGRNYLKATDDCGVRALPIDDGLHIEHVDAVAIAIHPRDSVDLACRILAHGIPVLIEKPAGLSVAQAETLAAAEMSSGTFVLVGHQHLFAERIEEMRSIMLAESDAVQCDAMFGGPGPVRDFPALWDYGPHAASCALALSGFYYRKGVSVAGDEFVVRGPRGFTECHVSNEMSTKSAHVTMSAHVAGDYVYDGYAPAEPALTRMLKQFVKAVCNKGTDDYRFGSKWAVDVAKVLEAVQSATGDVTQTAI
jgi:predicted dehydrogenase